MARWLGRRGRPAGAAEASHLHLGVCFAASPCDQLRSLFQEGLLMPMPVVLKTARALGGTALALFAAASLAPGPVAGAAPQKAGPKCQPLMVDVRAGTVNGLGPGTPFAKVKKRLPCFTGVSDEGAFYNYGGGV